MKRKSRLVVFILALVPGLSHLYLGLNKRALIYFICFLGICVGGGSISEASGGQYELAAPLTFFAAALVWCLAFVEALHLAGRMPLIGNEEESLEEKALPHLFVSDRKLMALAFSILPGAGHMFLGLLKPGAQLMGAFFLFLGVGAWLDLGLIALVAALVWFYSLFDIYHLLEEEEELRLEGFSFSDWLSSHPRWIGWGLIVLGILVAVQRLLMPVLGHLLSEAMISGLQSGFIALILIAGGIKLLVGRRIEDKGEEQ